MEQTKEKQIFEQMPVPKAVFTLAVPTVISQLIVLIFRPWQTTVFRNYMSILSEG